RRLNASKKHEIRMIAHRILNERISRMNIEEFVQSATWSKGDELPRETGSKLGADILAEARKIANLRHIGIKKTKLISTPESRAIEEAKPIESSSELPTSPQ